MQHKVKLTVIDKKLYPELQALYCSNPDSGPCPCYHVGDEFIFERYDAADDFWRMGLNTLDQTVHLAEDDDDLDVFRVFTHCSEAWDAISRYIYAGLQGGAIMRGWMNDDRIMIACCSDGTRPVIFKIERLDYLVLYIDGILCDRCVHKLRGALNGIDGVTGVLFKDEFTEVFVDKPVAEETLNAAVESCGPYTITKID